jgi:hypothetical protein
VDSDAASLIVSESCDNQQVCSASVTDDSPSRRMAGDAVGRLAAVPLAAPQAAARKALDMRLTGPGQRWTLGATLACTAQQDKAVGV